VAEFGRSLRRTAAILACCAAARADVPQSPAVSASESKGLGVAPARSTSGGVARETTPGRGWVPQTTVSLAGVLAVAVGTGLVVRFISKRQGGLRAGLGAGGRSPAGVLEVLGRYPVGRGATLVLLKLDRRVLLLSQSAMGKFGLGSSFSTLCEVSDADEVASILVKTRDADGDSMAEKFRSMLSRFDRSMDGSGSLPGGRSVRTSAGGDRAEMWDTSRTDIPVVDLTKRAPDAELGAAGSLRRRLAAIRWPAQEGGERP
jgi:hypothetical protein